MLALLPLLVLGLPNAQPQHFELQRGKAGYFAVEDTFLDQSNAVTNYGRDLMLSGGPGKAILIRFGDLERVVGYGVKVSNAKLRLPITLGVGAKLVSASRVLLPWNEGPGRRGLDIAKGKVGAPGEKVETPRWSTTWGWRRAGVEGGRWEKGGAQGPADVEVLTGVASTADTEAGASEATGLVITGLDASLQAMVDKPLENYGWRLEFDQAVEFDSSESWKSKPTLIFDASSAEPRTGGDLAVLSLQPKEFPASGWPTEGTPVKWVAKIANIGNAPVEGYRIEWTKQGLKHGGVTSTAPLAAGATTDVEVDIPWVGDHADHRVQNLRCTVIPSQPDARPENNSYEVAMSGLPVDIALEGQFAPGQAELALRDLVDSLHQEAFAQTATQASPDGTKERIRLQPGAPISAKLTADEAKALTIPGPLTNAVVAKILVAMGIPSATTLTASHGGVNSAGGKPITARPFDRFPGALGYGDTRDDSRWMAGLAMVDPMWVNLAEYGNPLVPQGYLTRVDVGLLNAMMGKLGADRAKAYDNVPSTLIVRLTDPNGKPLAAADVAVYQTKGGGFEDKPLFSGKTSNTGSVVMSPKEAAAGVRGTPFGQLKPDLSNGTLLFQVTTGGSTNSVWLPLWKLWDEYYRGNRAAGLLDLRLDVTDQPLDPTVNLAANKIVTDSAGRFPAQLQALVDGNPETVLELDDKPGAWLEIDLGRDRAVGEIDFEVAGEKIWDQFEIKFYNTSQKPDEARLWRREMAGVATLQSKGLKDGAMTLVPYRSQAVRMRFIRIELPNGGKATLKGIRVIPAVPPGGGS